MSLDDVEALSDQLNAPALSEVAASVQGNQVVVYGGESVETTVSWFTKVGVQACVPGSLTRTLGSIKRAAARPSSRCQLTLMASGG